MTEQGIALLTVEERIQKAIQLCHSQAPFLSVRKAANAFQLPKSTLYGRLIGSVDSKTTKEEVQKLDSGEEPAIK